MPWLVVKATNKYGQNHSWAKYKKINLKYKGSQVLQVYSTFVLEVFLKYFVEILLAIMCVKP